MDQNEVKSYIGIDVSKAILDVSFDDDKLGQFDNTDSGCRALIKHIQKKYETAHVVMEASGGYEQLSHRSLMTAGIDSSIVNAKQVRHFVRGKAVHAKTDRIDAYMIRYFGIENTPKPTQLPSPEVDKLSVLSKRRDQLVKLRKQELQHQENADKSICQSLKTMLLQIEKQITIIENKINLLLKEEAFKEKAELIRSFVGAGENAVMVLLSDLPELGTLHSKPLSMLVGLAPVARDSGKMKGKRTIYGGRERVRRAMYLCSLSASRHNPQIKVFYERLVAKGKAPKSALIACAHKILIILNAMIKNNSKWERVET